MFDNASEVGAEDRFTVTTSPEVGSEVRFAATTSEVAVADDSDKSFISLWIGIIYISNIGIMSVINQSRHKITCS